MLTELKGTFSKTIIPVFAAFYVTVNTGIFVLISPASKGILLRRLLLLKVALNHQPFLCKLRSF